LANFNEFYKKITELSELSQLCNCMLDPVATLKGIGAFPVLLFHIFMFFYIF